MKISLLTVAFVAVLSSSSNAAEVIPLKPDRYFNDYAGVVSEEAAHRFDEQLAQFERETSDQVVVAVFPKMQSDSDITDYTYRVVQAWGAGQKERPNGVVLFLFMQDRKMFIRVGYGLEGALSDGTAFDITEYQMKPLFKNGDYQGGLATGIDLICKAIRGEYVNGKLVTPSVVADADPFIPAVYDGAVVPSPAVDYNCEITTYRFSASGTRTIQWKLGKFTSNILTIEVTN